MGTVQTTKSSALKWLFFLLLAAHLIGGSAYLYIHYQSIYQPLDLTPEQRSFTIPAGATLTDVLSALHERQMAPPPFVVRLALLFHRPEIVVKKGSYHFPTPTTTWEIILMLDLGKVVLERLTLPEGLDKWETAQLLGQSRWGSEAEFMALIQDPSLIKSHDPQAVDLEGYLFPETYYFNKEATPRDIIEAMVEQFFQETASLKEQLAQSGRTLREWVALASLIEKETGVPEERERIAGVFTKRLKRGMLLQCDPTIIYALKSDQQYKGKIYRSQIKYNHPYNTYVYRGLPPGPIASPGREALVAALNPEQHSYLYFVAKPDGTHYFSKTLREHNRAVRRFLRNGG